MASAWVTVAQPGVAVTMQTELPVADLNLRRGHSRAEMEKAAAAGLERLKQRVALRAQEARKRNAKLLGDISALKLQNEALRSNPASKDSLQAARVRCLRACPGARCRYSDRRPPCWWPSRDETSR